MSATSLTISEMRSSARIRFRSIIGTWITRRPVPGRGDSEELRMSWSMWNGTMPVRRCESTAWTVSTSGTEFINVCFRVVHSREQDTLRVIWEQGGTVTRRGKVRIPESLHAYKTRAYLQVRPEYVGSWRVRIVPEGEENISLAVAEFEISN